MNSTFSNRIGEELNEEPKIQIINDFLDKKITDYQDYIKSIDKSAQPDTTKLDELFKQTINEVWS